MGEPIMQRPPFVWRFDIEAARRRLANMTDAERAEAAQRYIAARYAPAAWQEWLDARTPPGDLTWRAAWPD